MNWIIGELEKRLPRNKIDIFGKDSLLKTCLPYYILAIISASGFLLKNPNPFPYIALIYSIFPILD